METITAFVFVGIGGFIGSCLRYFFTIACKNAGVLFPLGTLISNVLAGLLIGFIMEADRQTSLLSPNARLFLTTGLLGGLSTFSTFSLETVNMFSEGRYFLCSLNVALNLTLSIIGVAAGILAAKLIFKRV